MGEIESPQRRGRTIVAVSVVRDREHLKCHLRRISPSASVTIHIVPFYHYNPVLSDVMLILSLSPEARVEP